MGTNSNCIFLDIRGMKKMICFLTGFLFFACSNNPAVTAAEVEDDWVYGSYRNNQDYSYTDREMSNYLVGEGNFLDAIVYETNESKYFQLFGMNIPPLKFNNGRAEYQDSIFKLVVEKNGDKFYTEFTLPKYYFWEIDPGNRFITKYEDYLKPHTIKSFWVFRMHY
jgi:hypothetical protein